MFSADVPIAKPLFDLCDYLFSLAAKRWRIARVSKKAADVFAAETMLGVTRFADIKRATSRVQKLWTGMLRELVRRRLYQFYPDEPLDVNSDSFNLEKFGLTYRRMFFCRPGYCIFRKRRRAPVDESINSEIRPCNRPYCPFCFARKSWVTYVTVKRQINKLFKTHGLDTGLDLVYRSRRTFVPVEEPPPGCDWTFIRAAYLPLLQQELRRHQLAYTKLARIRVFKRVTRGSLWRVLIVPTADGWIVETRQLILCRRNRRRANSANPFVDFGRGTKGEYRRVQVRKAEDDTGEFNDKFFKILSLFCQYPLAALEAPPDYFAAVMWAVRAHNHYGKISGIMQLARTSGLFCGATGRPARRRVSTAVSV